MSHDHEQERIAEAALRAASTKDELVSAWWREVEHFTGAARERLQDAYATKLSEFAPLSRAG